MFLIAVAFTGPGFQVLCRTWFPLFLCSMLGPKLRQSSACLMGFPKVGITQFLYVEDPDFNNLE